MKNNGRRFVCADSRCRLALDTTTVVHYTNNRCWGTKTLHIPVCKVCSGSFISMQKNIGWSSFGQPVYGCFCRLADQIRVADGMLGNLLKGNFIIPKHIVTAEINSASAQDKKEVVLPHSQPLDLDLILVSSHLNTLPVVPEEQVSVTSEEIAGQAKPQEVAKDTTKSPKQTKTKRSKAADQATQ